MCLLIILHSDFETVYITHQRILKGNFKTSEQNLGLAFWLKVQVRWTMTLKFNGGLRGLHPPDCWCSLKDSRSNDFIVRWKRKHTDQIPCLQSEPQELAQQCRSPGSQEWGLPLLPSKLESKQTLCRQFALAFIKAAALLITKTFSLLSCTVRLTQHQNET